MILLGIPCCAQSVADAARAAHQSSVGKTEKRKVITDDDLPATSKTDVALGPTLDSDLQAGVDHLRAVYMDICSDPSLRNMREFPPEVKRRLEEAARPLRIRYQQLRGESKLSEGGAKKLREQEEAEVETITSPVGKELTLEERKKIGAIRANYAAKRQGLTQAQSESTQRNLILLEEALQMKSDCASVRSKH